MILLSNLEIDPSVLKRATAPTTWQRVCPSASCFAEPNTSRALDTAQAKSFRQNAISLLDNRHNPLAILESSGKYMSAPVRHNACKQDHHSDLNPRNNHRKAIRLSRSQITKRGMPNNLAEKGDQASLAWLS